MDEILKKLSIASRLYQVYKYDDALKLVDEVLKVDKRNILACNLKASILIESWTGEESKISQMKKAISYLKILIDSDPKNNVTYYYNIGNAYNKIANCRLINNNKKLNKDIIETLELSKDYYQKTLELNEKQPQVLINKGNILDQLGRYLEAIECYDKAILIDNTHYNAWSNRGIACWSISDQVSNEEDKKILLHHAIIYLAIELELYPDAHIDDKTKKYVNEFIKLNNITLNAKQLIKEYLPAKKTIATTKFNVYSPSKMHFDEFYFSFCKDQQLFLNTHFDCNNCNLKTLDLIEVGFLIDINNYKKPYELMNRWNTLLDEYKTARFLLVLSQYKHESFSFLDKQRYLPDYSLTYIHNVELLKNSFLIVMGILDKIAFFINEYEELGLSDEKVNFYGDSIFCHKPLVQSNNYEPNIVAIDSVRRDLEKNDLKILVDIRNYLVHRYFLLHDIIKVKNLTYPYDSNLTPVENKMYHMDVDEFFNLTMKAFRIVRNLLFSLSFFIMKKENTKKQNYKGNIGTLHWTIDYDKNPKLKKIADDLASELKNINNNLKNDILKSIEDEFKEPDNKK